MKLNQWLGSWTSQRSLVTKVSQNLKFLSLANASANTKKNSKRHPVHCGDAPGILGACVFRPTLHGIWFHKCHLVNPMNVPSVKCYRQSHFVNIWLHFTEIVVIESRKCCLAKLLCDAWACFSFPFIQNPETCARKTKSRITSSLSVAILLWTTSLVTGSSPSVSVVLFHCLPFSCRNMKKLKNVYLTGNKMESLPKGVFRAASSIQTVDMMDNRLTRLEDGIFAGLDNTKTLRLGNNRISIIDSEAFRGLENLHELILSRNEIRDLQPKSFKKLINLERLDLGDNKISALFPLMFRGLEKLEELNLNGNPLIMVGEAVFSSMRSLRVLYLGQGRLRYLKANMFKGLLKLEMLELDGHNITYLQDDVFKYLPAMQRLQIINNKLTTINPCAFPDIRQIKEIRALNNPLVCTCSLQWAAVQTMPSVAGRCAAPSKLRRRDVGAKSNYDGCKTEDIVTKCEMGAGGSLATATAPEEENTNMDEEDTRKIKQEDKEKAMKDEKTKKRGSRDRRKMKETKKKFRKRRKGGKLQTLWSLFQQLICWLKFCTSHVSVSKCSVHCRQMFQFEQTVRSWYDERCSLGVWTPLLPEKMGHTGPPARPASSSKCPEGFRTKPPPQGANAHLLSAIAKFQTKFSDISPQFYIAGENPWRCGRNAFNDCANNLIKFQDCWGISTQR